MSEKKNIGLVIVLIIFVLISLLLGGYIVYDKMLNNNNNEVYTDVIKIDNISIEKVTVSKDSPNNHLFVSGKIKISYDENKYFSVNLSGYCIGSNDEKYIIYGPGSGKISYYNYDTELNMIETINNQIGDVIYSDGNVKSNSEINWDDVKIKSCKIDKLTAYLKNSSETTKIETDLNYEKILIND